MRNFAKLLIEHYRRIKNGNASQRELGETLRAMNRILNGTYGLCESCKRRIPRENLERIPWTRECPACCESVAIAPSQNVVPISRPR